MGKYANSDIHDKYSDWHWQLTKVHPKYKRLYVSDIDRLWIEYDFNLSAIVAIFDIKWEGFRFGREWFYHNQEVNNIIEGYLR